jgi:hypothetical protein
MIANLVSSSSKDRPARARWWYVHAGRWHWKRCYQERYGVDSTLLNVMELFLDFRMSGTNAVGDQVTGCVGGECVGQVRCG